MRSEIVALLNAYDVVSKKIEALPAEPGTAFFVVRNNIRRAAREFMQECALQQAILPKDVHSVVLAAPAPPPRPAAKAAPPAPPAPPSEADQLRTQLEVLHEQRRQIEGFIKTFKQQGQKDEVETLRRSRLDVDLEIARVEKLLKALHV